MKSVDGHVIHVTMDHVFMWRPMVVTVGRCPAEVRLAPPPGDRRPEGIATGLPRGPSPRYSGLRACAPTPRPLTWIRHVYA